MTETKKYPPATRCIYCGVIPLPDAPLTDEHIIPLGLDGNLIFKGASCIACNKVTSRFEQICLQRMFREPRVHLNIPKKRKRRRKKVPGTAKVGSSEDGRTVWRNIAITDHPGILVLPDFGTAGILENKIPSETVIVDNVAMRILCPDFEGRMRRNKANKVFQILAPGEFCQMLAKIGHSHAVAELGLEGFEPLLPDVILGARRSYFTLLEGEA